MVLTFLKLNIFMYLVQKANMVHAKPMLSPMAIGLKLTVEGGKPFNNPSLYRSNVEGLQYVIRTRLKILYFVNNVCCQKFA